MKLAMAQMCMHSDSALNLEKSLNFMKKAKEFDLLVFPEIQLSPFFPQYEKQNAEHYLLTLESNEIALLCRTAKKYALYTSPNLYLSIAGNPYDASLWITPDGTIEGISKMVHVLQAEQFYECDYYTPSDDGFKVFHTPFGKIGIVICFDRHLPESIRTCTLLGAQLIIIPTANTKAEPMEMFEWEMRVAAMQNNVFIAMCNRVGKEDRMEFCGESILIDPDGNVLYKADDSEKLIITELNLQKTDISRQRRPYILTRRPE